MQARQSAVARRCGGLSVVAVLIGLAAGLGPAGALAPAKGAEANAEAAGGVEAVYRQLVARTLTERRDLSVEDPVYEGEELRTGRDGRARIAMADGALLTLGDEAVLRIDRLVFNPDGGNGAGAFTVLHGAFRMTSGALGANGAVQVDTPIATIGIRGTDFWGYQDGGALSVVLLDDGRVEIETPGGRIVLDEPRDGIVITDPAAPLPAEPLVWDEDRIARAVETIAFPE
ncbi:MAG: FecR family protein [Marivibrio sp.]|uniref:FecR family protein n=1 Tax=Marivibrio sp. TaxID=2039719 RepID=UPI0032ED7027